MGFSPRAQHVSTYRIIPIIGLSLDMRLKMKTAIKAVVKIGTLSSQGVFIRGIKPLNDYKTGDRITFMPCRNIGARWENGVITGWSGNLPLIERF